MICFGFAGGGLVVLMLQYVSGGKWGLFAPASAGGDDADDLAGWGDVRANHLFVETPLSVGGVFRLRERWPRLWRITR